MNDRHDDPLDRSIRSALQDIIADSPAPGELPVRSLELHRQVRSSRARWPMLVAAGVVVLAGVAGTVAIVANRSTPSNTVTLAPEAATVGLAEAQALLDESVPTRPDANTQTTDTTVVAPAPDEGSGSDPVAPAPAVTLPGSPTPDSTTPDSTTPGATGGEFRIFDASFPQQVRAGDALLVEWSVENPNGVNQSNFRVGGTSGWVSWCPFPVMGQRISGDERLGRYRAECTVPANAPNDIYYIFFQASSDVCAPCDVGGDFTVSFRVFGGSDDLVAPVISNVSAPSSASVGDTVTITWRAVDPSGVDYSIAWLANGGFALHDGTRLVDWGDLSVTRISGDEFDGVYSQTFRFYERSPLGTYTIWFSRRDGVGNKDFDQVPVTIVLSA